MVQWDFWVIQGLDNTGKLSYIFKMFKNATLSVEAKSTFSKAPYPHDINNGNYYTAQIKIVK